MCFFSSLVCAKGASGWVQLAVSGFLLAGVGRVLHLARVCGAAAQRLSGTRTRGGITTTDNDA